MVHIMKSFGFYYSRVGGLDYDSQLLHSMRLLRIFIQQRKETSSDKSFIKPRSNINHNCLAKSNGFHLPECSSRRFLSTFNDLSRLSLISPLGLKNVLLSRRCYKDYSNDGLLAFNNLSNHDGNTRQDSSADRTNSLKVEELVSDILKETQKVDVMAGSLPSTRIQQLVELLHNDGFEPRLIKSLLSGKLWLLQQPDATLTLCRLLVDHGMAPSVAFQVIHGIPHPFRNSLRSVPAKVNSMLLFLRNFGFSEEEIYSMVAGSPSVLFQDERSTRMAVSRMKSLFSAADTKKIVCVCPNVLAEDWSSIQAKFDYCIYTMGYAPPDMISSQFFRHSLTHIENRHLFLLRSGVFKVVNRKLHPSLNPNPPLKQVVDTSVESFVRMVKGVSVEDYVVFRMMRDVERGIEESEDEDEEAD